MVSEKQAALILGISPRTVRAYAAQGKITRHKYGASKNSPARYDLRELETNILGPARG